MKCKDIRNRKIIGRLWHIVSIVQVIQFAWKGIVEIKEN